MDKNSTTGLNDRGVSSVQFVLASGLALILFLALANLVVVQYGRGALRSALEQGARAGTVAGPATCVAVAAEVIDGLLGGRMSEDLSIGCEIQGSFVVASGHAVFESWTPMTSDFFIDMSARAVAEP